MSVLNHELYNVMKKVETQHSGKAFIIKGLNSTSSKSKKRKSLVISNPIPCNTAFPTDHVSLHTSTENGKDAVPLSPVQQTQSTAEESSMPEESSVSSKDVNSSDSEFSSSGANTPKRQSVCDDENAEDRSAESQSPEEVEAEAELATNLSDDSGVGVPKSEAAGQEVSNPSDSADSVPESPEEENVSDPPTKEENVSDPPTEEENVSDPPTEEAKPKPPPVPAPRISFRCTDRPHLTPAAEQEETEEASDNQETATDSGDDSTSHNPPGFLYKGVALESHAASEDGLLLQFEQGDVILVLSDPQEDGLVRGVREESWNQHRDLQNHSGIFSEKLLQPIQAE